MAGCSPVEGRRAGGSAVRRVGFGGAGCGALSERDPVGSGDTEQIGNSPYDMIFQFVAHPVGIDDIPEDADQFQPLVVVEMPFEVGGEAIIVDGLVAGLAASLPQTMEAGLLAQHVPEAVAHQVANMPPVASLFAAFLGYNPMGELIPADVLHALPAQNATILTGNTFFPELMSGPFKHGLVFAFTFSAVLYLVAAFASWRGGRRVEVDLPEMMATEAAGRR